MKKFFLISLLLLFGLNTFSQVEIEKSSDIVVVLGRKYYVHKVKKGETLYSISRVYKVPTSQILLINKEKVEELKAGSALRIPVIDKKYEPIAVTKITFTEHKVDKNESLYAISKQYGITQDEIIKHNPQIKNGLKKGMILKIPVKEKTEIQAKDDFFVYHQIKRGENLKLIARQYGVTIDDIKKFNENTSELIPGEILTVPKETLSEEQIYLLKYNEQLNPDFLNIDPNYFEDSNYPPCEEFVYNDTMSFKIALLLPLFITRNYSLSFDALSSPEKAHFYNKTKIFFDYLHGTFLAINELKKEGVNLKLYIYDTKADSATLETILKKYEMKKMDLIFGPVYSKNYNIIRDFCAKNKINVISPFTSKLSVLKNSPFVFKIKPSYSEITKFTARYMADFSDTSLIAVVSDGSSMQMQLADSLHKSLVVFTGGKDSLDFKKITFSRYVTPFKRNLDKNKHNYVFIPSTNEVQVSAILNNLNALVNVNRYKITVFTLPVIEYFKRLQAEWFFNLDIHYAATTVIDDNNWEIKNIKTDYVDIFGIKPTRFSMIGYDVTYYFISALKKYGKYFQFCLGNDQEYMDSGLFMKFYFQRTGKYNGFENKRLNMLYYTKELKLKIEESTDLKTIDYFK